ncbi:transposase, partial [Rubritalea marina]
EIARLTGLAPLHFESGNYKGVRKIYGGRARPRTALYMAAVVALRHNPELKSFGARLRDAGKAGRAIVIAVARKLLIHLNSLVKKEIYGI